MPGRMRTVARLNPMTYAIDAPRQLSTTGWQVATILAPLVTGAATYDPRPLPRPSRCSATISAER